MSPSGVRNRSVRLIALGAVLLIGIGYPLVAALTGYNLTKVSVATRGNPVLSHDARPWLIAAALAALGLILDWGVMARGQARILRERDEARGEAEQAQNARAQAEAETERARRALENERADSDRLVQDSRTEHRWSRDLHSRVIHMQRERGALGRHDEVREMVLELTMGLVEAEKGILISHAHEADGRLEVVCSLGFDHDPGDSAIAQHFASRVLDRDSTIRQDDSDQLGAEGRTPADDEVDNLLAIPIYLLDDFSGVIVCANREGGFSELEDDVLLAVGDHAGMVLQNSRLHGDLRNAYLSTIAVLADAIELKDPELRGHSDAVSGYVLAVADRLDFEPQRREELVFASLLHDVGKLGISERILLKPAALTQEERAVMQLHPRIGYQLIRRVPALRDVAPAVLHHHERFDGTGYPGRLTGEAIPLEARIIAVADTFSAITSERPYSPARSVEQACAELERCAGEQFDPHVVALFIEEVRRCQPQADEPEPLISDPEFDPHRLDGEFKLGALSFGIIDSLTLLYSHRHFHETVQAEVQRASLQDRSFAVLIVEVQDLAEINNTRGYVAGDASLQAVAAVMQRAAGRCQGRAFRISGRRFALIAPGADEASGAAVKSSLDSELSGQPGLPQVSIGLSSWRPGDRAEPVVARAQAEAAAAPVAS